MKIEFDKSGGFAGLAMSKSIDSEDLSPEESEKLSELVCNSNFFSLPEEISSSGRGADKYQYRITVEEDGKKHTVDLDEAAIPPNVRPLIQWLNERPYKK